MYGRHGVMDDLQARFGRIALVSDRCLISEDNLDEVAASGLAHVLATRLHHDDEVAAVLERAAYKDTSCTAVPEARCFGAEITHNNRRFVVVFSPVRYFRDRASHAILCAKVEEGLLALVRPTCVLVVCRTQPRLSPPIASVVTRE
jgi:hypothetical protein